MKALVFHKSILRYATLKLIGPRVRSLYTSRVVPLTLRDIPEPELPTQQWLRIKPRLTGICGSDLATICAKGSPYLAPVTSMPFVMGHETVGVVSQMGSEVENISVGDRVVLQPALGCTVRGIEPACDACQNGHDALCRNVTRGDISSGIQTGYCRDTGGGCGESLVAHQSQVYRVPDELEDRSAVLIEPFACALHGALRASPQPDQTVLVIGCGSVGLLTIAALRATGCRSRIFAVAKYDHQRQFALAMGADELLDARGSVASRYQNWANALGAEVLKPELGNPMVIGGADVTYDCVASSSTMDDGLRFTQSGGTFVLVGMPGIPRGVDFTTMWYKELTLRAAYAYGHEQYENEKHDTFDMAIEIMKTWGGKLSQLVSAPFALSDYHAAFRSALNTGQSRVVKTVFAIE